MENLDAKEYTMKLHEIHSTIKAEMAFTQAKQ
jgi:hypothetical protein